MRNRHTPAAALTTHGVELFVKGIGEAHYIIPAEVIGGLLLQIIAGGCLIHTQALVEQVDHADLQFTHFVFQDETRQRQIQQWNGLVKSCCLAPIMVKIKSSVERIVFQKIDVGLRGICFI